MIKRTYNKTNDKITEDTLPPAKIPRTDTANFSFLPGDIYNDIASFLDNHTLVAFSTSYKPVLESVTPELKHRLASLSKLLTYAAGNHIFILAGKGLYACGNNSFGQLGLGDNKNRDCFYEVPHIEGTIQQVMANVSHTFILTDQGLYTCGNNSDGQLGLGDNQPRYHFTPVFGIKGTVQQVIAGLNYSFTLTDKGLYACGNNYFGQLGLGNTQSRYRFTQVLSIESIVQQIIVGGYQTFMVTDKGLYACGNNASGQLGLGDNRTRNYFTQVPNVKGTVQQVIVDVEHTFVLTDNGLYACGNNEQGKLGLLHTANLNKFQCERLLPKELREQGGQLRLFRYLIKAGQSPHFFQPAPNTPSQDKVQQANRTFTASL